jgi:hypothetical protein
MSYSREFLRLVVIGRLYGVEDFSYSLSFVSPEGGVPPNEVPPEIFTALADYWGTSGLVSNRAEITLVKLNEIGTDGRYTRPFTVQDEPPTQIIGNTVHSPAPQTALAVSLTTPIKRGRAHAGRYYLPIPGTTVQADGRLLASQVLEFARQSAQFVNACNDALDPYRCAVVSDVGVGTWQPVTGVRVGRVLDTIRSRRNKFLEEHQEAKLSEFPA